jgi:lipocalin
MNPIYKRVLRLLLVGVGVYLWSRHDPKVPSTPPTTVPFVDVIKYAGTWYEIASIPMIFQRGCTNTRAIYSLKDDKTIEVKYVFS